MSSFQCEHCGAVHLDSPTGYATGCEHYPADAIALGCATHRRGVSSNIQDVGDYQARECECESRYAAPDELQAILELLRR